MKTIKGIIKPSELTPFIKNANLLNTWMIVLHYSLAAGLVYVAHIMNAWWVTLLCIILMGGIQNTLATFIHETAHGHVFSNKNLNDKLGQFFFAAPFLGYMEDYRYFHWEHHRHTGKIDKDPELAMYASLGIKTGGLTRGEIIKVFMMDIIGVNYIKSLSYLLKFFSEKKKAGLIPKPTIYDHLTIVFWLILLPLIMWKLGMLKAFALVWFVPMLTVTPTLLRWHGYGEHIREKDSCLCENTFTHKFDPITTFFLYPIQSGYHLEHHLYPQLPWHAMKKFRKWAEENPQYKGLASELEADAFFVGEKSIVKMSFSNPN